MQHFCTYFDSHYVDNGIALYRSLNRHCEDFHLHILALDQKAYRIINEIDLPHVSLISLETLEEYDKDLHSVRDTRPLIQYYFTTTPIFPLYLLEQEGMNRITYLGSDLYFYSPVELLIDAMNDSSVVIHTHRRPPGAKSKGGKFNADFVSFKNDDTGRECLETWRENCIEWCYGRLEDGKWSCQGYLKSWPKKYDDLAIIDEPGVGLARWNRETHTLSLEDGEVRVDGEPLIFYHFSNLQRMSDRMWKPPMTDITDIERNHIYEPYIKELMEIEKMIRSETGETVDYGSFIFPKLGDMKDSTWRAVGRSVLSKVSFAKQLLKGDVIVASKSS